MTPNYALLLLLQFATLQIGSGLKCYQCTSATAAQCKEEPFVENDQMLKECNRDVINWNKNFANFILPDAAKPYVQVSDTFYCTTLINENKDTVRTCMPGDQALLKQLCDAATTKDLPGRLKECTYCDKDGCNGNGSSAIATSFLLIILALVASCLFY